MPVHRIAVTAASIGTRLHGALIYGGRRLTSPARQSPWNPYRIYRVDPRNVSKVMVQRLPERYRGTSLEGNWDHATVDIEATLLFRGLRQRFVEGRDWAETELHPERYVIEFANAPRKYATYSVEEFLVRGRYVDQLYEALLRHGYRSHLRSCRPFRSEMAVNIGRDGVLIRNSSGLHRLVLSQLIGLATVPVRVLVAHSTWITAHGRVPPGGAKVDSMDPPEGANLARVHFPSSANDKEPRP